MSADEIRRAGAADALSDDELLDLYAAGDRERTWLRANFVSSLDGAATHNGLSAGLGSPADRRVFDLLRRLADVIVVGAGTVRAEGYGGLSVDDASADWRLRNGLAAQPVFAVVSASLDLDPPIFADNPVRPLVLTVPGAPADRRAALAGVADLVDCGEDRVDTRRMLRVLAERGLTQVHSEGGPHMLGAMTEEGTLDELCLTLSPRLEGGVARRITDGHPTAPTPMTLAHVLTAADGTLLLRYTGARF
ncbi:pyrimidine reductase family protein [Homoserinimonas sp. A447]